MGRIMCIDYGGKRTGIAVTDPLKIIATGIGTIDTKDFIPFLKKYFAAEEVDLILLGMPVNEDGSDTHATPLVRNALAALAKNFPAIPVKTIDERYSSKLAKDAILQMGLKKKDRRDKKLVDEVAAAMMLQEYLQYHF